MKRIIANKNNQINTRFVWQSDCGCNNKNAPSGAKSNASLAEQQLYYEKIDTIAECQASLKDLSESIISCDTGYLYGRLWQAITGQPFTCGGTQPSSDPTTHKAVLKELNKLAKRGLNVNKFGKGDKISISTNEQKLTVTRSNGSTESYDIDCNVVSNNNQNNSSNEDLNESKTEKCTCDGKLILLPLEYSFIKNSLQEIKDSNGNLTALIISVRVKETGQISYLKFTGRLDPNDSNSPWYYWKASTLEEYKNIISSNSDPKPKKEAKKNDNKDKTEEDKNEVVDKDEIKKLSEDITSAKTELNNANYANNKIDKNIEEKQKAITKIKKIRNRMGLIMYEDIDSKDQLANSVKTYNEENPNNKIGLNKKGEFRGSLKKDEQAQIYNEFVALVNGDLRGNDKLDDEEKDKINDAALKKIATKIKSLINTNQINLKTDELAEEISDLENKKTSDEDIKALEKKLAEAEKALKEAEKSKDNDDEAKKKEDDKDKEVIAPTTEQNSEAKKDKNSITDDVNNIKTILEEEEEEEDVDKNSGNKGGADLGASTKAMNDFF